VTEIDIELSKMRDDAGQIGFEIEPSGGRLAIRAGVLPTDIVYTTRAAPTNAFDRRSIGVGPTWAFSPLTMIRMPLLG
jgi:hypothetical protein